MATDFQYYCLENSMDRGAWLATVHGGTESDRTEQLTHTNTYTHTHFTYNYDYIRASQVVLVVKTCLPKQEMQEMLVRSLGQEDPLEEVMSTHSSILT